MQEDNERAEQGKSKKTMKKASCRTGRTGRTTGTDRRIAGTNIAGRTGTGTGIAGRATGTAGRTDRIAGTGRRIAGILTSAVVCLLLIALMSADVTASAIVANPDPKWFMQPDGTALLVTTVGDEFLGWNEDADGNLIIYDINMSGYCYADWTQDGPVSTGELAGSMYAQSGSGGYYSAPGRPRTRGRDVPRDLRDRAGQRRDDVMQELMSNALMLQDFAPLSQAVPAVADVNELKRDVIVIHVTWSDRSTLLKSGGGVMDKLTGGHLYNLVFNPAANSVDSYYRELFGVSESVILPANTGSATKLDGYDGVIEVTMPGQHTNPRNDSLELLTNAMQAAADSGFNYKAFDKNNDGRVTSDELSICFIIDGFETSSSPPGPSFWGVAWSGSFPVTGTNPVTVASFFGQGAFHRNTGTIADDILTVGIICHEMAHSGYNFADTYDYGTLEGGSNSSSGHGNWSLMASGSWGRKSSSERNGETPGYVDAFNLVKFGIVTPGALSDGLNATMNSHLDIFIAESQASETQYFLLQQRKFGAAVNYDRGTFFRISSASNTGTGGALIYHIEEGIQNASRVMEKRTHYGAAIEEAHGGVQNLQQLGNAANSNNGDLNDLWGTTYNMFGTYSDPSSGLYSAYTHDTVPPTQTTPSGVEISSITWNSGAGTTSFTLSYQDPRCFIESFTVPGQIGSTVIDEQAKTIKLYMPLTADLTNLTPNIVYTGASISPAAGAAQDFTAPQTYRVTAENGDYADYTVTVLLSVAADGLNFDSLYAPTTSSNLTNSLGRYIYYGTYSNNGTPAPRLWYVTGEENGSLVLVQKETYANEARIFAPTAGGRTWGDSEIYAWLNNSAGISDPFADFFAGGELGSINITEVNTTSYDGDVEMWVPMSSHGSSGTMFYLLNAFNTEGRESDNLSSLRSSVSWSASLDNWENKLINPVRITPHASTSTEYWLRSARVQSGFQNNVYVVWNSGTNGVSIGHRTRENAGPKHVRPVFRLDPNSVVFISEVGGAGIGATAAGNGYAAGTSTDRNYKLTVVGSGNGSDVGTLHGVPAGSVLADTGTYTLTGLTAVPNGSGNYTLNYKIVYDDGGGSSSGGGGSGRIIIDYGSSADLTELEIDTSALAGGEYTVHVWLQRNNAVHSNEATIPQYFTMMVPMQIMAEPLYGVTSPAAPWAPSTDIDNGTGFTASLTWDGNPAAFEFETIYTATVTLTAKFGYTFGDSFMSLEQLSGFTINGNSPVQLVSSSSTQLVFKVEFPSTGEEPGFTVTLNINRDGTGYVGHAKTFTLRQGGEVKYTGTGLGSEVTFEDVLSRTYNIFDGENDTGRTISVYYEDNDTAGVDYYTIQYTAVDAGTASGSSVSAVYNGAAVKNGEVVLPGGELIMSASGSGAQSYAYTWSGTYSSRYDTIYIAPLDDAVNIICTVTGYTPVFEITASGHVSLGSMQEFSGQILSQTVTVTNTGTGAVTLEQITVEPEYFEIDNFTNTFLEGYGQSATFTVRAKADLPPGSYSGTVEITGTDGVSAAAGADFTVTAQPISNIISASPLAPFGELQHGYWRPDAQTVIITGGAADEIITLTQPVSEIYEIGALSAEILDGEDAQVTFTVCPISDLPPGNYDETIFIYGSDGAVASVSASFTVAQAPVYNISATRMLTFGSTQAGDNGHTPPEAMTVTVSNIGTSGVSLMPPASEKYEIGALSASMLDGHGESATFTVRPLAGLTAGVHDETIYVHGSDGTVAAIHVTYTVIEPPVLYTISATSVGSFGTLQWPYTQPAAQTVTITNTGTGPVTLTQPVSNRYEISALSQTELSERGASATFTIRPMADLPRGDNSEKIVVLGSNGAGIEVNVSFNVIDIIYGDANDDGRVNGTDIQTMVLWINRNRPDGEVNERSARVTGRTGRPDASDVLAMILWINDGGRPLDGHPRPSS